MAGFDWPSGARGAAPKVPASLDARAIDPLVERNGFTIVDVTPENMTFQLFDWRELQPVSDIDTLEPHAVITVARLGWVSLKTAICPALSSRAAIALHRVDCILIDTLLGAFEQTHDHWLKKA